MKILRRLRKEVAQNMKQASSTASHETHCMLKAASWRLFPVDPGVLPFSVVVPFGQ